MRASDQLFMRYGLARQTLVLVSVVAVVYLAVAAVAARISGNAGLIAAGVAALLCTAGAEAGLVLAHTFDGSKYRLFGIFGGMLPRMGIPLAAGLTLQITCGVLAEAGLLVYLVVFYTVTLGVGMALAIPSVDGGETFRETSH